MTPDEMKTLLREQLNKSMDRFTSPLIEALRERGEVDIDIDDTGAEGRALALGDDLTYRIKVRGVEVFYDEIGPGKLLQRSRETLPMPATTRGVMNGLRKAHFGRLHELHSDVEYTGLYSKGLTETANSYMDHASADGVWARIYDVRVEPGPIPPWAGLQQAHGKLTGGDRPLTLDDLDADPALDLRITAYVSFVEGPKVDIVQYDATASYACYSSLKTKINPDDPRQDERDDAYRLRGLVQTILLSIARFAVYYGPVSDEAFFEAFGTHVDVKMMPLCDPAA